MALHIWKQDTPGGSWTELDTDAMDIYDPVLTISYTHPSQFSFSLSTVDGQYALPINPRSGINFYDTDFPALTGGAFSTPCFEGHVFEGSPGNTSQEVVYSCMDATRRATEIGLFSGLWTSDTPPVPGTATYPRVVFNCETFTDPDYAFSVANGFTVGQIIQWFFQNHLSILRWHNAAPASFSAEDPTDLAGDNFQFIPQEKVVFESEKLPAAVRRMLTFAPKYGLMWFPGYRRWRFLDKSASPAIDLVLNDQDQDNVVLACKLTRILEGRATAIKFYGPENAPMEIVNVSGTTLDTYGTATVVDLVGGGTGNAYAQYQVHDSAKRKMARMLPEEVWVQVSDLSWSQVKWPVVQVKWPGNPNWQAIDGWRMDVRQGIITFPAPLARWNSSSTAYQLPTDVQFVYGRLADPISVRYPTSGYSGSMYTEYGMAYEEAIYDDMMATHFEHGLPQTTTARQDAFVKLAQAEQEARRDIVYAGTIVLAGIRPEFLYLDKRINVKAIDANGDLMTLPTDSANMSLTDVRYEWEANLTTLTLSSDWAEVLGFNPEQERQRLKIRALTANRAMSFRLGPTAGGGFELEFISRTYLQDTQGNEVET